MSKFQTFFKSLEFILIHVLTRRTVDQCFLIALSEDKRNQQIQKNSNETRHYPCTAIVHISIHRVHNIIQNIFLSCFLSYSSAERTNSVAAPCNVNTYIIADANAIHTIRIRTAILASKRLLTIVRNGSGCVCVGGNSFDI